MMTTTTTSSFPLTDAICVPTPCVVVALHGPDTRRFCNSVFSNNARDLAVGAGQCSAMLDDRGRIQGLMRLYCVDDTRFVAVLDGMPLEAFQERYRMYVVLDDVTIEAAEDWSVVQGLGAMPDVPSPGVALRLGTARWEAVGPASAMAALREGHSAAERDAWTRARVREALPEFPVDFTDRKRLPHEMNLKPAYLSFEKGCYIGQETVNRVDVMGQVKRHLVALNLSGAAGEGTELRLGDKAVGQVTSVVSGEAGDWLGLAVLREPHNAPGTELSWDGGSAVVQARS